MDPARHTKQVIDPVCGMEVDPAAAQGKSTFNGAEFYFCSSRCKEAFESKPENYTASRRKGFWQRYLDRLNKATGGRPPSCCH